MSNEPAPPQRRPQIENEPTDRGAFYHHAPPEEHKRGETLRMVIAAFAIVLFGLTLAVVFILPRYLPDSANPSSGHAGDQVPTATEQPAEKKPASPATVDSPEQQAPQPAMTDPAELAEQRQLAQNLLGELDEQIVQLATKNAAVWAAEKFAMAKTRLQDGERAYGEQRYEDAISTYREVKSQLDALDKQSHSVLTDALAEGEYALSSGDSAAAKKAFERAILIQPDHEPAVQGKQRAENLDEVLALINEAQGFEDLNEPDKALERYEAALALDAKATSAQQAVARIKAQQTTSSFNAAMSRGLQALEGKKYLDARKHFTTATKINPGDANAKESLQQANELIRSSQLQSLLRSAVTHKKKENWVEVENALLKAKKIDNSIANIDTQIDTARDRQTLERQLIKYTKEAHRLRDDDVHLEALSLLDKAKRYTAGPKLRAQIADLQQTINTARAPQAVVITSDGATEVTVFKVGQFGILTQKDLQLLPGQYVAVGKRSGYRDVRVEFSVGANTNNTVDVRCVEPVQFGPR